MHTIYGIHFENDKWYIGRTNNYQRRISEHKQELNSPKHQHYAKVKAMHKYKYEFVIIEQNIPDELIAEREQYWIKFYNSYEDGYNMTFGGEGYEKVSSENHSQAKLTLKQVQEIRILLQNTEIPYQEIANTYHVSKSSVCNINTGANWHDDSIIYPLRKTNYGSRGEKNPRAKLNDCLVMEMRQYYTEHTIIEVCEKYNYIASDSAIRKALSGESYTHLPIYKKKLKTWINL